MRRQILDVDERLVQTRGFNDFSCADIAVELGVTTATRLLRALETASEPAAG